MSVALQIRDVPEEVRDVIAEQADRRGQSMQAFLLDLVTERARVARRMDVFDATARLRRSVPLDVIVDTVREGRDVGFDLDRDEFDR